MTDLTTQLQSITHPGLFAEVIRKEVKDKPEETLKMIASQIKDNRVLLCEIIGENLVCLIETNHHE
jgi:hypothetical protein